MRVIFVFNTTVSFFYVRSIILDKSKEIKNNFTKVSNGVGHKFENYKLSFDGEKKTIFN